MASFYEGDEDLPDEDQQSSSTLQGTGGAAFRGHGGEDDEEESVRGSLVNLDISMDGMAPRRTSVIAAAHVTQQDTNTNKRGTTIADEDDLGGAIDEVDEIVVQPTRYSITQEETPLEKMFAAKRNEHAKYDHQHNKDPAWYQHEKHVLVCSWSGRPIFTRYGDDSALAAYMGVVSAIISNFQRTGDTVRVVIAGETKFVFLLRGPIYLVAISKTTESVAQLRVLLQYVHLQIISTLTKGASAILTERPGYDLRELMGGTENLLRDMINNCDSSPGFLLDSFRCIKLERTVRTKIGEILRGAACKDLLFSIVLYNDQVVQIATTKNREMVASDLALIVNFVTNSQSLRVSEHFVPICLPGVSEAGYLYAYVHYLTENISLSLVTTDTQGFFPLQTCKQQIQEALELNGCLKTITQSHAQHAITLEEMSLGVPELFHFIYKSEMEGQYTSSAPIAPYHTPAQQQLLFRQFQHMHACTVDSAGSPTHSLYYEARDNVTLLTWIRQGDFQLYATFSSLVSKDAAITACNRTLAVIKRNFHSLFIHHLPVLIK